MRRRKKKAEKYVRCPGCSAELPINDLAAQVAHMETFHPQLIAQRHVTAGIRSEYTAAVGAGNASTL